MGRGTTLGVYLIAISSSGSLLLLLLLHFQQGIIIGASAASVPATGKTCEKVVAVETVELLSYLGNITFPAPTRFSGRWKTVIKFTSPYTFIGGWGVVVQSFGRKAYAIFERSEDENLTAGDPVVFQFRVLYMPGAKVPKVYSIRWENTMICGGQSTLISSPSNPQPTSENNGNEEPIQFDPESSEEETNTFSSVENEGSESYANQQHISTNNVRLGGWK